MVGRICRQLRIPIAHPVRYIGEQDTTGSEKTDAPRGRSLLPP